jgi:mannose-6-phosphate isomerase-like protein (cupin superfamily)
VAVPTERDDAVNALGVEVVRPPGPAPSQRDVEAAVGAEGLTPHAWGNGAGYSYARHAHGYHKVLFCVSGSIVFHTDAGDVALGAGDRMELAPGVEHGATVGDAGVVCVEAYRP